MVTINCDQLIVTVISWENLFITPFLQTLLEILCLKILAYIFNYATKVIKNVGHCQLVSDLQ